MSSISPAEKKRQIFKLLIDDDVIVNTINGVDIKYSDELLGKYIFPYLKIDYTVQDVGTYIGVKVDYVNTNPNPVVKDMTVTFLIMSNTQHILTELGDTRTDILADEINKLLVWNNNIGFSFYLVSDNEDPYDETFYYRKIILRAREEDNILSGKKNK